MTKTTRLTVGALMLALAIVLSFMGLKMPFGGRMTLASMVPIIFISYIYDVKWALLISFAYSLLQMVCDFSPPPVQNFSSFFAVCMLDYILAFTILGLAGAISSPIKNVKLRYLAGTVTVVVLRFICHLISGILIWSCYAPEGQSPLVYSILYNGGYMSGELIITTVAMISLSKTAERLRKK